MSDLLIKGMEMPKDIEPGLVIEFADGIDGKRYVRLCHYRYGSLTEWLEAVPVPPHGDLIDRNALLEGEGRYFISLCKEGIDVEEIFRAKVIIPASEER